MQFRIPCETFARLSNVCNYLKPDEKRPLNVMFLDYTGGNFYAVVSNSIIAAVQYLGKTDQPDFCRAVILDPQIINQCRIEADLDGELIIDTMDIGGVPFGTAITTFGYKYPSNALFTPPNKMWERPWNDWRKLFPDDVPIRSKGFLFMDTEQLTNLGKSSPSGRFVFPAFIDVNKPVMVRDVIDPDWVGLFLPRDNSQKNLQAATRPEWLV